MFVVWPVVMPESPPLQNVGATVFEQPEIETPKGIANRSKTTNVTNRRVNPPRPTGNRAERSHRKR